MNLNNLEILDVLEKNFGLDPKSSKVLIVGLGNTGISVAHYLNKLGFKFAVTDSREKPPLKDVLYNEMPDIPVFTNGFDDAAFKVATHLIVSPGVSMDEKQSIKRLLMDQRH